MEHDQEMHAHPSILDQQFSSVYPHDLNLYDTPASFLNQSEQPSQRYQALPQDAFRTYDQHEAGHVYNLLPLALDPSALDLRSNFSHDQSLVPSGASESLDTTPTGSLRLSAYNPHDLASPARAARRRDPLDHLQLQVEAEQPQEHQAIPPHQDQYDDSQHQPSDMQNIDMHAADVHMHLNDSHGHTQMTPVAQEQTQTEDRSRVHNYYPVLPDAPSQSGFYMSEAFTNSPTNSSTTSDASPHSDFQTMAPATGLGSSSSSSTISRSFRSSSLSMGMSGNRSMPLIPSSPLSPPHLHHSSISSHPHMHPSPYYSVQHNTGSPGFPTTPVASHHAQGSSSSSHSSGHTRYSFRGSPVPRTFPRGHSRSNSYGTLSTISVRSSSPASSVTSGFTSLSGGPGSAPASTGGALGSPISYDCGDVPESPTSLNAYAT
ncbi:hypothetical protein M422DRAFT_42550 [Sphaerobolus stellatus SS14]|nr:hypothetical protein M422DRAFT_42550 [Sphaerobolus stellatus SS14]